MIKVPKRLSSPHPLVQSAKVSFDTRKIKVNRWNPLVSSGNGCAHIYVSPELIPRALRIMDALLKVIEKEGFEIKSEHTMSIWKHDQSIELALIERQKRVKDESVSYDSTKLIPSGNLCIRAKSNWDTREYVDTPFKPLEEKMDLVFNYLVDRIEYLRLYQIKLEEGWEKQRIEKEAREAKKERVRQEFTAFSDLLESSTKLRMANEIRAFILKRIEFEDEPNNPELLEWIEWANKKADWIDPLIECEDEYLNNKHKSEICSNVVV